MSGRIGARADGWSVIIPVKRTLTGKSRLTPFIGRHRPELAHAMTIDTVEAVAACRQVVEIVVVTDDAGIAEELPSVDPCRITIVPDEPDAGLNPALIHGVKTIHATRPDQPVAAMFADLPALRPDELGRTLTAAHAFPASFVPDAAGVGTTLYCVRPPQPFEPRFGGESRRAHQAAGAVELDLPDIDSVRHDVDNEADLDDAVGLGIGARTRQVLAAVGAVL